MSCAVEALMSVLRTNPNHMLVASDGKSMFILITDPEEKLACVMAKEKNFNDMSEAETNDFIQKLLKK